MIYQIYHCHEVVKRAFDLVLHQGIWLQLAYSIVVSPIFNSFNGPRNFIEFHSSETPNQTNAPSKVILSSTMPGAIQSREGDIYLKGALEHKLTSPFTLKSF